MSKTKEEIVRLVKEGNIAVAWITSKGALVHIPTHDGTIFGWFAGVDAAFFNNPDFPEPVLVVDGVKGLSAVDPEWDGSELSTCSNPDCRCTHNSNWNTHDNIWKKANV